MILVVNGSRWRPGLAQDHSKADCRQARAQRHGVPLIRGIHAAWRDYLELVSSS